MRKFAVTIALVDGTEIKLPPMNMTTVKYFRKHWQGIAERTTGKEADSIEFEERYY